MVTNVTTNLLTCVPGLSNTSKVISAINSDQLQNDSILDIYNLEHSTSDSSLLNLKKSLSFSFKESIYDIDSKLINDDIYLLTRLQQNVNLYRLNDNTLDVCNNVTSSKNNITSCTLSNEIPGMWLQTDDKLNIKLYDSTQKYSIWKNKIPNIFDTSEKGTIILNKCSAVFAYPGNVSFAANRHSIYRYDFRHEKTTELISMEGIKDLIKLNNICCLVPMESRPYLFSVMSEQVLLLDERNCKVPVLSWSHMLTTQPRRAVIETFNDLDVLMLSNNIQKRVSMIGVNGCCSDYSSTPRAKFLTNHCGIFDTMTTVAHKNGLWFDSDVTDRLELKITGLTCVKSKCNDSNFDVLFLNTHGDVFSQHLLLNTSEPEANAETSKEIKERLQSWEESVITTAMTSSIKNNLKCVNMKKRWQYLSNKKYYNITEKKQLARNNGIIQNRWKISDLLKNKFPNEKVEVSGVESWKTILLNEYFDDKAVIHKDVPNSILMDPLGDAFSITTLKRLNIPYLLSCTDKLSQTILSHWPLHSEGRTLDMLDNSSEYHSEIYRASPYSKATSSIPSVKIRKCKSFPLPNGDDRCLPESGIPSVSASRTQVPVSYTPVSARNSKTPSISAHSAGSTPYFPVKSIPSVPGKSIPSVSAKSIPSVSGKSILSVSGKSIPSVSAKSIPSVSGRSIPSVLAKSIPSVPALVIPSVTPSSSSDPSHSTPSISVPSSGNTPYPRGTTLPCPTPVSSQGVSSQISDNKSNKRKRKAGF